MQVFLVNHILVNLLLMLFAVKAKENISSMVTCFDKFIIMYCIFFNRT